MPTSDRPAASLTAPELNKRIIPIVFFTFICYLTIGIPLAILPGFTHTTLGFSPLIAGIAISVQYFSTLASRPYAGRCADLLGEKKIVLIGLLCCALSGACYLLARATSVDPALSLGYLFAGRLLLGVGESFASTRSMLWGIGTVGQRHTGRVISWNGVATYGAIAIGAPLGVFLNSLGGLALAGGFILLAGICAWGVALRRPAVSVSTGKRIPFTAVVGKVWLFGLVLGLGTLGFGVIVSFITLYYADRGWEGAAFALTLMSCAFVGVRLVLGNVISRFGGRRVALLSFMVETAGLVLLWAAPTAAIAGLDALLTGAGFSLVFPALGVEAMKQVPAQNQGTALGTYCAFLDLALGVAGPAAGLVMSHLGMSWIYLAAALMAVLAALLTLRLKQAAQIP
ncbi:MFS transporter [Sodalis praecaptivus]|uniref:MFS transporter n=1 Tax=Sodalis praecaptivus TaxID=1239307 RepID=UPI0028001CC5|nr:MFS transporter [Sodalis praecaptivus]CAJ0993190.1 putative MFS-type transporter YhhS [Sodalis praecaptivus]